jgi:hypothetical protein
MEEGQAIRLIGLLLAMPGVVAIQMLRGRVQRLREVVWEPAGSDLKVPPDR